MKYPKKLSFPSVTSRSPEWILELELLGTLPNGAGQWARYRHVNNRQHGMDPAQTVYLAISGRLYGPYFCGHQKQGNYAVYEDELAEVIKELDKMIKAGETVKKLPGRQKEWCLLSEGKEIS